MKKSFFVFAALAIAAVPVAAQDHDDNHMEASGGPMADMMPLQDQFMGWVLKAAQDMPQENYNYRPTEEVRSFGQLIGHVAGANYLFCSAALGVENPNKGSLETLSSKAELITATENSIAFCKRAYGMPHGKAHDEITFFGSTGSITWVLAWNLAHNAEHYGNLVTYIRMNEMVPPSSQ